VNANAWWACYHGAASSCEVSHAYASLSFNKKGIKWTTSTWGPEQAQAYDAALGQFTTLHHPVGDGPMRLTTDWSREASGGVLTQEQEGQHVPIGRCF
jgi:hypothetical protein